MFKSNKSNQIRLILIFFLLLLTLTIIYKKINSDGMSQKGIVHTYYRVYSNGEWSKWSKDGTKIKNNKDNIKKIEIKLSNKEIIEIDSYDGKWIPIDKNKKNIKGIKLYAPYTLTKKYDLCYRTYNKEDKWLEWNCIYGGISGNINENITNIEIKTIPINVNKYDYLKDYNNSNKIEIGF